ncbi:MAG TPA: PAS domain S-box protein [Verrucomicrobiae bacterium]|nr:PAS domain S-box protein [Verrucomicrobiae bacterium]
MPDPLRVLMVEDSEDDSLLLLRELQRGGFEPILRRVESAEAMSVALDDEEWDVIISDYCLPLFSGPEALGVYQRKGLDIPFIIVSGAIGEETAVELMKAGVHDYLMKDRTSRLASAVRRELAAARERRSRKLAEAATAHLAAIVESCEDAIIGKTLDGTVVSWNAGAERLYGYTAAEMIGRSVFSLVPACRPRDVVEIFELLKQGERLEHLQTVRVRKDGSYVEVDLTISPIQDATGRVIGASSFARDISQAKQEERERLKLIQELSHALAHIKTLSGLLPFCASCKRIRNDAGYWQAVEVYIKEHSNAQFASSVCPDCASRPHPEPFPTFVS